MQNHTQLPTGLSFSYETERLILRLPSTDYLREIHDFLYRNRSCFEKYEPTAPENYYTLDFQQTLARCELKLALKLSSVRFYVFLKEDPSTIIGTVCLHNIIKMPYFTSEVGYKFDASYQHHGYAREALSMALSVGFYGLGLHKIFARCMPENTPSRNRRKCCRGASCNGNANAQYFSEVCLGGHVGAVQKHVSLFYIAGG